MLSTWDNNESEQSVQFVWFINRSLLYGTTVYSVLEIDISIAYDEIDGCIESIVLIPGASEYFSSVVD